MTSDVKCCPMQQNLICLPRTIYTSFKPAGVSAGMHQCKPFPIHKLQFPFLMASFQKYNEFLQWNLTLHSTQFLKQTSAMVTRQCVQKCPTNSQIGSHSQKELFTRPFIHSLHNL